ncbi:MAG: AAA family ATPase [Rhizobiales bacterium]|nr:AAA family ATPase [Hyphomicrobiales bacterium]
MDPVRNPYSPGAGTQPPELAGRAALLDMASIALQRIARGRAAQSLILVGLRGVGKTVLLNRMREIAEEHHYRTVLIEAHEGKSLPELLAPRLREILLNLNRMHAAKAASGRALRALVGFVRSIKITIGEIDIGIGMGSDQGVADSGDVEADLPVLMVLVAQAAEAAGTPVAILIDEIQYLKSQEFSALIMAIHAVNQRNLPLALVAAGLPQTLGLAGNSKSYAERLFRFPMIGPLTPEDARTALVDPARAEGVEYTEPAVAEILRVTERYPYFLQQWGYEAWNAAEASPIDIAIMPAVTAAAIAELDESFFKVRFERCTPSEKRYMRALAEFGPGAHRSGDIADLLGVKVQSVGPVRNSLIKKGMIYSPSHGDTEFTVPMFDQFMRRVMPQVPPA